jgi:hypothetical protein
MQCPNCNQVNRPNARFCSTCGAALVLAAPRQEAHPADRVLPRAVVPVLLLVALVLFVYLVVTSNPPQVTPYQRILDILAAIQSWNALSAILWIVFLVIFAFWMKAGVTLSKFRLAFQFFA